MYAPPPQVVVRGGLSPFRREHSFVVRARMGKYTRDPVVWDTPSLPKVVLKISFKLSYLAVYRRIADKMVKAKGVSTPCFMLLFWEAKIKKVVNKNRQFQRGVNSAETEAINDFG